MGVCVIRGGRQGAYREVASKADRNGSPKRKEELAIMEAQQVNFKLLVTMAQSAVRCPPSPDENITCLES